MHHDGIRFLLFVLWILLRALWIWQFHYKINPKRILRGTTFEFVWNFAMSISFFILFAAETAECAGPGGAIPVPSPEAAQEPLTQAPETAEVAYPVPNQSPLGGERGKSRHPSWDQKQPITEVPPIQKMVPEPTGSSSSQGQGKDLAAAVGPTVGQVGRVCCEACGEACLDIARACCQECARASLT